MTYWPGTNIIKSQNNDFDWRIKTDFLDKFKKDMHYSVAGRQGGIGRVKSGAAKGEPMYMGLEEKEYQKGFTTFSKAKPSVFNGKGNKI